jgi:hypothetical protein
MKKAKKPSRKSDLYTPAERERIALAAAVSSRTVVRHLDGATNLRPSGRARIVAALKTLHGVAGK